MHQINVRCYLWKEMIKDIKVDIQLCFSVIMIEHWPKSNLRRKGFPWLTLPGHSAWSGTPRAEREAKTRKECCFLPCFPPSDSAGFLIPSRTTCLGVAPLTLGWALLTDDQSSQGSSIVPTSQPDGSNSPIAGSLFPRNCSLCQFDKN